MRFAALFALSAAIVSANAVTLLRRQFPSCATPCLVNANYGGCNQSDDTCLCNSSVFVNSVTECIISSCSGNDLQTAEQDAQQLCLAVGVTLTATPSMTPSGSGSSTPSATAPSSSGSGSAKSSAASTSSSGTSAPSATHTSGARSHGVPALAALAAVGAVALAL